MMDSIKIIPWDGESIEKWGSFYLDDPAIKILNEFSISKIDEPSSDVLFSRLEFILRGIVNETRMKTYIIANKKDIKQSEVKITCSFDGIEQWGHSSGVTEFISPKSEVIFLNHNITMVINNVTGEYLGFEKVRSSKYNIIKLYSDDYVKIFIKYKIRIKESSDIFLIVNRSHIEVKEIKKITNYYFGEIYKVFLGVRGAGYINNETLLDIKSYLYQIFKTNERLNTDSGYIYNLKDIYYLFLDNREKPVDLYLNELLGTISQYERGFSIAFKADGIRYFILTVGEISYFFNGKNIFRRNTYPIRDLEIDKKVWPYMFDCEVMANEGLELEESRVFVFDCISKRSSGSITEMSLQMRIEDLHKASTFYDFFIIKPHRQVLSVETFFPMVKLAINDAKLLKAKWDGLIITLNKFYKDMKFDKTKRKSVTYKWKPKELLTVDMIVGKDYKLYVGAKRLYVGSVTDTKKIFPGVIYEFAAVDRSFKVFEMVRARPDKPFPNTIETYESIKSVWFEPISIADITGETSKFDRLWQREFQKKEIMSINASIVLDIGSGRGGVLQRAPKEMKFFLIEPNASRSVFPVLKRRAELGGHVAINGAAEKISWKQFEKVQAVFIHQVASFFTDETRRIIIGKIKRLPEEELSVSIISYDGRKYKRFLANNGGVWDCGSYYAKIVDDKRVLIRLKDAFIPGLREGQTEYFVYFEKWKKEMDEAGFDVIRDEFLRLAKEVIPKAGKTQIEMIRVIRFKRRIKVTLDLTDLIPTEDTTITSGPLSSDTERVISTIGPYDIIRRGQPLHDSFWHCIFWTTSAKYRKYPRKKMAALETVVKEMKHNIRKKYFLPKYYIIMDDKKTYFKGYGHPDMKLKLKKAFMSADEETIKSISGMDDVTEIMEKWDDTNNIHEIVFDLGLADRKYRYEALYEHFEGGHLICLTAKLYGITIRIFSGWPAKVIETYNPGKKNIISLYKARGYMRFELLHVRDMDPYFYDSEDILTYTG